MRLAYLFSPLNKEVNRDGLLTPAVGKASRPISSRNSAQEITGPSEVKGYSECRRRMFIPAQMNADGGEALPPAPPIPRGLTVQIICETEKPSVRSLSEEVKRDAAYNRHW
jgi:hypothetical protein